MQRADSPPRPLSVMFPAPMIAGVDAFARRCGVRRSAAFRELVTAALTERGLWPPHDGTEDVR